LKLTSFPLATRLKVSIMTFLFKKNPKGLEEMGLVGRHLHKHKL
jgi:hypothetical protein